jgi:hypothetical protein
VMVEDTVNKYVHGIADCLQMHSLCLLQEPPLGCILLNDARSYTFWSLGCKHFTGLFFIGKCIASYPDYCQEQDLFLYLFHISEVYGPGQHSHCSFWLLIMWLRLEYYQNLWLCHFSFAV